MHKCSPHLWSTFEPSLLVWPVCIYNSNMIRINNNFFLNLKPKYWYSIPVLILSFFYNSIDKSTRWREHRHTAKDLPELFTFFTCSTIDFEVTLKNNWIIIWRYSCCETCPKPTSVSRTSLPRSMIPVQWFRFAAPAAKATQLFCLHFCMVMSYLRQICKNDRETKHYATSTFINLIFQFVVK